MHRLLLAVLTTSVCLAAADPTPPLPRPSPGEIATELTALLKTGRIPDNLRINLDGDTTISRFEALAACAGQAGWIRRTLPALFARLDGDRDGAIARDELLSLAALETEAVFEVRLRTPRGLGPRVTVAGLRTQPPVAEVPAAKHVPDAIVGAIPYGRELIIGEVILVARRR